MVENYRDAIDFLFSQLPMYQRTGSTAFKKTLDNIYTLCEHLGNPQHKFKSIHIAGTNGKGSTAHFLSSILMESGLTVGMYTSPHYIDFRERIKIDGTLISESAIIDFINSHIDVLLKIKPSFFEMCVALAFDYFSRQNVDVAVIETGLGGRLDSTNIINPLLSIITNIDYDHQDMLGDTLGQIASEKAGIIKPRIPVIIGEKNDETNLIFSTRASELKAPIEFANNIVTINVIDDESIHLSLRVEVDNHDFLVKSSVSGDYQINNIRTTIAAINMINNLRLIEGLSVSISHIQNGIAQVQNNTYFLGRWQIVSENPLIIIDSGHNKQGVAKALTQISDIDYETLHLVTGFVGDKNWKEVLELMPSHAQYYFARPDIPRGLDVDELYEYATELRLKGKKYKSVIASYKAAKKNASEFDLVLVLGSTFVAAEVLSI